jgi:hypothetical protein
MTNQGIHSQRLHPSAGNPQEVIFAEHWERRNTGYEATLKWLLGENNRQAEAVTDRERAVAATVIQWLGSPVGFSFLEAAMKDCGYELREKEAE